MEVIMEVIMNNLTGDILISENGKKKQLYKDKHGYFVKSKDKTVRRFTKKEEQRIKDFIANA